MKRETWNILWIDSALSDSFRSQNTSRTSMCHKTALLTFFFVRNRQFSCKVIINIDHDNITIFLGIISPGTGYIYSISKLKALVFWAFTFWCRIALCLWILNNYAEIHTVRLTVLVFKIHLRLYLLPSFQLFIFVLIIINTILFFLI